MVDLRRLEIFAKVVDAGSFSGAARGLGITKAAVSKHVAVLEEQLGTTLLHRTTRKLSLSDAGAAVLVHCERIVEEAALVQAVALQASQSIGGRLRIAAPVGLGQRIVAPVVAEYLAAHPRVSVDLVLDDHLVDVIEGRFDVAIRAGRLPDSALRSRRIGRLDMTICAAPGYLERAGRPTQPRALTDHAWITFAPLGQAQPLSLTRGEAVESIRVVGRISTNDGEALRTLACGGVGLVALPTFWVEADIAAGRLQPVLPRWRLGQVTVHAVHTHGANPPRKVTALIDMLTAPGGTAVVAPAR